VAILEQYRELSDTLRDGNGSVNCQIADRLHRIESLETDKDIQFILSDVTSLISESSEGASRISRIVQDLKNFAHPGDEKLKPVDLNKNIESTLNVVWNEIKYKAIVHKDYGKLPDIPCYPQQLNQVFMNILVNAAHAISDKGEIRIATLATNGNVEIRISDTGSGIPRENIPKLFDPFFTTKEVGKGTGLGLHVAYDIIKKHHGMIDVESTVGRGSTFTIRLPLNQDLH
jgi:signal transduction histidine kinase